jgi:hypothetical protein
VSIARADARFLLPEPVRSAVVLDGLERWAPALASAGVEIVAAGATADLVVAPARLWREALASGARGIVLEGGDRRTQLHRAGLSATAHLPVPSAADPAVLLPLGRPTVARYALTQLAAPRSAAKALRNRVLGQALGWGARLPGVPLVTVATAADPVPRLVQAAARELAMEAEIEWLLAPGRGDVLARGSLQLFPAGAREPSWALKFSRVRGHSDAFDRDECGLALAAAGGPVVQRHAPRFVGRFTVDGLEASLETAAPGPTLTAHLHGRHSRAHKLATIEAIAAWIVDVAAATSESADMLAPELDRLAEHVAPKWGPEGAGFEPRRELADVPATLQHNDLGSWNIVVYHGGFNALDWEDARAHGLPLWDLLYLLMDALAHLDSVPATLEQREQHFARLFRGELESSRVLFHWLGQAVTRLGLRREAIPELTAFCWMHHGLSPAVRREEMQRHGQSGAPSFWLQLVERLARRWLTDPGLGRSWPAWHAR